VFNLSPIFAVHISDGVLTWQWLVGGFAVSAIALSIALYRIPQDLIPRIGVLTGVFFVASQLHITLGPTSVHLLLNGLLGAMLGFRATIAIAAGTILQALLVGHGGLTALGVNCAVMALPAVFMGAVFCALPKRYPILLGFFIGTTTAQLSVLLQATVLYLGAGGNWAVIAEANLLLHIPIIVLEGFTVAFALKVLAKARPEWLGIAPELQSSGNTSSIGTSH